MMNKPKAKIKGLMLVRDSDGNPKFDDFCAIDSRFFSAKKESGEPLLTDSDLSYIKKKQEEKVKCH